MAVSFIVDGQMEDWSRGDWERYMADRAEKIATQRVQWNRSIGAKTREGDAEKYASEYKRRMLKAYPFEKLDGSVYEAIARMDDKSAMEWLDGYGIDPMSRSRQLEFEKFKPILSGIAEEGQDWYSMDTLPLQAFGAKLGYDTGTKEGLSEFLDKVGEMQKEYDRSRILAEMKDVPGSTLTQIAYPTLTKAIENAVADPDNNDLSKGKAVGLGLLDAGINAGMFMSPSVNLPVKYLKDNPLANGIADAVLQGVLEEGRQAGGDIIADVEPDYAAPTITAITAGATRPAMMGTAQGLLAGFTGPSARQFSRGIMGSMRTGNPVYAERKQLEEGIDLYNQLLTRQIDNWVDNKLNNIFVNLPEKAKMNLSNKAADLRDIVAMYGVRRKLPNALPDADEAFKYGPIDKAQVMEFYDNLNPAATITLDNGRAITTTFPKGYRRPEGWRQHALPDDESSAVLRHASNMIDSDIESKLRTAIPAKMAELDGMSKAYRAGLRTGEILGDVGGRFEPTFKLNPLNPFQSSPLEDKPGAYKKTPWYQSLSDDKKKIVDEAFSRKKSEK